MVEIWAFDAIISVAGLGAQSGTVVALGITGSSGEGNEGAPHRISRLEICVTSHSLAAEENIGLWQCSTEMTAADMLAGFTGQYNSPGEKVERAKVRGIGKLIGLVGGTIKTLNNGLPVVVTPNQSFQPTTGNELGVCLGNFDNVAISGGAQEIHIFGKAYGVWL